MESNVRFEFTSRPALRAKVELDIKWENSRSTALIGVPSDHRAPFLTVYRIFKGDVVSIVYEPKFVLGTG